MTHKIVYKLNDNLFELSGWQNTVTDSFINESSSVFLTIMAIDSTILQNSLNMTYVASSDGVYRVIVDKALDIEVGCLYNAVIDASGGTDLESQFVSELFASHRKDA